MLTKEQFLQSVREEIRIMKHLATKVKPGTHDWRPTPPQRSTLELLQYLTYCGTIGIQHAITDSWDHAQGLDAASKSVTPETFAAAMDAQMAHIESLLRPLSDDALLHQDTSMPWGPTTKLGQGLIDMGLKPLVAYRMQLFLYAKQSGNPDIGPANCWVGVDGPKQG